MSTPTRGDAKRLRPLLQRAAALAALLLSFGAAPATALSVGFDLNVEFDDGITGTFAHVTVVENAGDLDFTISLTDALGSGGDLHRLYFNLLREFTNLSITSGDGVATQYGLAKDPAVLGGAGAGFDWGILFGNGAGRRGNGILKSATFTLTADQDLFVADLFEESITSRGIAAHMAAHVQGTDLVPGFVSETVGGRVPEPVTGTLLAFGLIALSVLRPARSP